MSELQKLFQEKVDCFNKDINDHEVILINIFFKFS